ncbi:MAG: DUF3791 domain-containing protein [Bacteroidales bacterium]|nr:DUF3791 domain-containing protein [Bacteroidales bacterium]
MEKLIELSQEEVLLGFVASCIEYTARRLGRPYQDIFARMQRTDMINSYLIPCYDTLHTESREHVTDNVIAYLKEREELR